MRMAFFIPLSVALNIYIIEFGFARNENDVLIKSYYTLEVFI